MGKKFVFICAGSPNFSRALARDILSYPAFADATLALVDIDKRALEDARVDVQRIIDAGHYPAKVIATVDRTEVMPGADGVVSMLMAQPLEVFKNDLLICEKYGVSINVGDTRNPAGIFRFLRTMPVMMEILSDVRKYCPDAIFLNYTNPMAMLTGAMQRYTGIKTVGLCHSVQVCAESLLKSVGMENDPDVQTKIAGINHMAWLLEITKDGKDLYPEIKARAAALTEKHNNMVRLEIMKRFGYYVTESSEHNAEYMPFFIKDKYPEQIDRFNIPLDEYPRRCIRQIADWEKRRDELTKDPHLTHTRTHEYASYIMEAMETGVPYKIGGNVLNNGLITNLPRNACVEVPCLVDRSGVTPCYVGDLPEQCAALNRTNINVQLLTIEAAMTRKKETIYQAAMMDPHLQSELSIDDIVSLCDDLIAAHQGWLPEYH